MRFFLFIFFIILSSVAYVQKTEGASVSSKEPSVAAPLSPNNSERVNDDDPDALDSAESAESSEGDNAEADEKTIESRKHQDNHKVNINSDEDVNSGSVSSSQEEHKDVVKDSRRKEKVNDREELEKFVGRFVIDYLITRLRVAKKRLVASLLSNNESHEDDK